MDDVLSAKVVEAAGLKAKEVAEQQERDREAEEARNAAVKNEKDANRRERERPDAEPRVAEQPARGRAEAARRPEVHVDLGLS